MNIAELFEEVANKMRADVEAARKALTHSGLKGAQFEEVFRRFLRDYLPAALDISTGQIVDSTGAISRQLDVIISDSARTPILYRSSQARVVPAECVYTVIEVKAHLDTRDLDEALTNMDSVRSLQKRAYYSDPDPVIVRTVSVYGKEWSIWPIQYFLFAYDSISVQSLAQHLITRYRETSAPSERRIDMICVLDKGVICNYLPDGTVDACPVPGSFVYGCETKKALLLFYTLASRYFSQAWLPNFRFRDYLGEMQFGPAEELPIPR